jgi:hypothetical protein
VKNQKRALQVTIDVREPSVVELTVNEKIQIDRLRAAGTTVVAERHGALVAAGTSTLTLDPGRFAFKTMSDAHLRVVHGGAHVAAQPLGIKDKDPNPLDPPSPGAAPAAAPISLATRGDAPPGELPTLTVA